MPVTKAVSKKGLQINADMLEDAEELNVHNSVINIDFSQLLAPPVLQNSNYSYSWKYNGKTYWFVKDSVSYYDRQLQSLKSTSSVNSAVLLLSWRDDLKGLIYFTDGQGTFPERMPDYQTAFVFIQEGYSIPEVPVWAIRLILDEEDV